MTAWIPHLFRGLSATSVLLLVLCAQSSALARAGSFLRDEPWNTERIDHLPTEVRNSVLHMCRGQPTAAHYFATYFDIARIIRLRFEDLNCEGTQPYRDADRCLRQEFILSGSRYRLSRSYYGRCGD